MGAPLQNMENPLGAAVASSPSEVLLRRGALKRKSKNVSKSFRNSCEGILFCKVISESRVLL